MPLCQRPTTIAVSACILPWIRIVVLAVSLHLLLPAAIRAAALTPTKSSVTLAELLDAAVVNNLQLISADAQAQRYNTRIALIDKLNEPLLAFYYLDFPVGNISHGEAERINQAQAGPATKVNTRSVRGKILTGRDMIENQALWFEYRAADLRLQVVSQIREAFFKLYFLDKALTATENGIAALAELTQSAAAQYAVGNITQTDVLNLQEQRYRLKAELLEKQQQRRELATRLNYLAARPITSPLDPFLAKDLGYEDLVLPRYTAINLISGLFQNRPLMKGYQALGGRFRAMRGMVKMYFNRDLQDEASFEADSGLRAIKAEGTDFYNDVSAAIQTTMSDLTTNRELADLYGRVLIPQARQLYQLGLADFEVGRRDYQAPLTALLNLFRYQEKYYQALTAFQVDMARLEGLSGIALNTPVVAADRY